MAVKIPQTWYEAAAAWRKGEFVPQAFLIGCPGEQRLRPKHWCPGGDPFMAPPIPQDFVYPNPEPEKVREVIERPVNVQPLYAQMVALQNKLNFHLDAEKPTPQAQPKPIVRSSRGVVGL